MTPADFFRSHGLVVEDPRNDARWHRVPTEDKPKQKNGAYRWDGAAAFCKNWATMTETASWRDDTVRPLTDADRKRFAAKRRAVEETQEKAWQRAAERAAALVAGCKPKTHGYLIRKGFPEAHGLVLPDGNLLVPMRDFQTNAIVGAQTITWLPDERQWQKRFLPSMRAKGAVFKIGSSAMMEVVLCEGLVTGMSIEAAIRELRLNVAVIACFSAHNMVVVAEQVRRQRPFIFADHDASGVGAECAKKTGRPWTMSPTEGYDANDEHQRNGLRSVCGLLLDLRRKKT